MTTHVASDADTTPVISSGLSGLDDLLGGGFMRGRAYQVRGQPGTGKTILGWHFLTAAGEDETSLMITFDEPEEQHRAEASKLGMDPSAVEALDLSPTSKEFADQESFDVFVGPESNGRSIPQAIAEAVEETSPDRIVVDSMLLFRYLSSDAGQRRKQMLAFLRYLKEQDATVLLLSELVSGRSEDDLHFLSDGILELKRGGEGRTVSIRKQRGQGFRGGTHSVSIGDEGLTVYPRLQPAESRPTTSGRREVLSSGVPEIDQLLGGGFDRGTVTMISGPSGAGKTTLGLQLVKETAAQGELRKAIGVLKRRTGSFESNLRKFQITEHGLKVGKPLTQLRGVLTGTPEWVESPAGQSSPGANGAR